jgi:hypothetical protein
MSESKPLPGGLERTVSFLLRAYPNGLPDADYLPLIFLLLENLSHRNLATVVAHVFGRDFDGVLNDIGNAVAMEHSGADAIGRVRSVLVRAGYEEWLRED